MKQCNICKLELSFDLFHKTKGKKGGVDSRCKNCSAKYHREMYSKNIDIERKKRRERNYIFRKENPLAGINSHLKVRYGITLMEKLEMLNQQGGRCKICKKDIVKIKACVDHDHKIGRVRGLLCDLCNHGLGSFQDNIDLLNEAISYLTDKN